MVAVTSPKCLQHELKETGHTPELTAEHDGKEVPVKRQIAANRKPPLRKSCSLDAERQTESRCAKNPHNTLRFTVSLSKDEEIFSKKLRKKDLNVVSKVQH